MTRYCPQCPNTFKHALVKTARLELLKCACAYYWVRYEGEGELVEVSDREQALAEVVESLMRRQGLAGGAAMNIPELRAAYVRLKRTLRDELSWRDRAFPAGHPLRADKLAEINQALADLRLLGKAMREILDEETPEQLTLIDAPVRGGY